MHNLTNNIWSFGCNSESSASHRHFKHSFHGCGKKIRMCFSHYIKNYLLLYNNNKYTNYTTDRNKTLSHFSLFWIRTKEPNNQQSIQTCKVWLMHQKNLRFPHLTHCLIDQRYNKKAKYLFIFYDKWALVKVHVNVPINKHKCMLILQTVITLENKWITNTHTANLTRLMCSSDLHNKHQRFSNVRLKKESRQFPLQQTENHNREKRKECF